MKRCPLSFGAAALGLALSLAPMAARAQTAPDAALEARYQQGADLRERQQDAQALAIFQEIYAQTRQPRALAQVGMAEGALGAEVWIDGRRAGAANTPLRVLAGTAHFEVRAQGHAPVARVATVPAGGLAREAVSLVAAGTEPARAPTAAPAQAAPVQAASHPTPPRDGVTQHVVRHAVSTVAGAA